MKQKFTPEAWIQFIALVITGACALGGTIAYCFTTFATKDEVETERQERREMKAELDQIYGVIVPESQRRPLEHHHYVGEKE